LNAYIDFAIRHRQLETMACPAPQEYWDLFAQACA
jgi:hypothetical protein